MSKIMGHSTPNVTSRFYDHTTALNYRHVAKLISGNTKGEKIVVVNHVIPVMAAKPAMPVILSTSRRVKGELVFVIPSIENEYVELKINTWKLTSNSFLHLRLF